MHYENNNNSDFYFIFMYIYRRFLKRTFRQASDFRGVIQ